MGPGFTPLNATSLQEALRLEEVTALKLGKILLKEYFLFGGSSSEVATGALLEASISDRVIDFRDVHSLDQYLQVSTRLTHPGPFRPVSTLTPSSTATVFGLRPHESTSFSPDLVLHPEIAAVVERHLAAGLNAEAVIASYGALRDLVRDRSGLHDLDGHDLFGKALSPDKPLLTLADTSNKLGKDYQRGVMLMCEGFAAAVRNPITHRSVELGINETNEMLAIASLLFRRISDPQTFRP